MVRIALLGIGVVICLALAVAYWQVALPIGLIACYVWLRRRYNRQAQKKPRPVHAPEPAAAPKFAVDVVELPTWFSVRGESHRNSDGSDRQKIIARCKAGDHVRLVREPKNAYDSNAVAVVTRKGQVGYLSREQAAVIAPLLDDGMKASAFIGKIVGGTPDKPSRGVFIEVEWEDDAE